MYRKLTAALAYVRDHIGFVICVITLGIKRPSESTCKRFSLITFQDGESLIKVC